MARRTRLANKTQWALQDIIVYLEEARRCMRGLQDRNEQRLMDPLVALNLNRLGDALNRIEITTVRAQHGEYGYDVAPEITNGKAD